MLYIVNKDYISLVQDEVRIIRTLVGICNQKGRKIVQNKIFMEDNHEDFHIIQGLIKRGYVEIKSENNYSLTKYGLKVARKVVSGWEKIFGILKSMGVIR